MDDFERFFYSRKAVSPDSSQQTTMIIWIVVLLCIPFVLFIINVLIAVLVLIPICIVCLVIYSKIGGGGDEDFRMTQFVFLDGRLYYMFAAVPKASGLSRSKRSQIEFRLESARTFMSNPAEIADVIRNPQVTKDVFILPVKKIVGMQELENGFIMVTAYDKYFVRDEISDYERLHQLSESIMLGSYKAEN